MEFAGKVWKDGKFWLVEVSSLNVMTQGKSRKDALDMIKDAIQELITAYYNKKVEVIVTESSKDTFGISCEDSKILLSLSLRRVRERSGTTVREASTRLGSKSPNAYSQYEKGKINISLDKYEKLLHAANPKVRYHVRLI